LSSPPTAIATATATSSPLIVQRRRHKQQSGNFVRVVQTTRKAHGARRQKMKRIHELARVDADEAAGISLLAHGGLVGGNFELRQCLRCKHTIGSGHGQDLGFGANADTHFLADTKPQPQRPQDAV